MKVLVQRVAKARVTVDGETIGAIGPGLLVFVCAVPGDDGAVTAFLARKIANLRVFADEAGKMNRSLLDVGGAALVVSQFTLAAAWHKGNRPGFSAAAAPDEGERLYGRFCADLAAQGVVVETGRFGASMRVHLVNDGPVTLWLDTGDPS